MKHLLLYLLLACTLILPGACTHPTTPPVLLCADSLASANPDSAQALLVSLAEEMKQEPQDVQMYYRLLCIKAKDKAYITHTSDSAILPVVEYYEREGDKKHLPEAYYYAGRVYRDLEDAPQATEYFYKAGEAIEKWMDYDLAGRIHTQIGTLYLYQDIYDKALPEFHLSYHYNTINKDSNSIVYNLRDIGRAYTTLEKPDSAILYYKKAIELAERIKNKRLEQMVWSELCGYYTTIGLMDEAAQGFIHLKYKEKEPYMATLADYYLHIHNLDSAYYYYYLLSKSNNYIQKQASYKGLGKIARIKKDYKKSLAYFDKYQEYSDSIFQQTQTETVRKINALYNYQLKEKENNHLKLQNLKQRQTSIFLIIAFALLSGSGILYYLRRKKAMQHRLKVAEQLREEAYRRSREFMEENNRQIQALESDIERLKHQLHDSDQQKMELEQKISIIESTNRQVELEQGKRRMEEGLFFRSDIYGLFRQKVKAGKAPGQTEWEQLARQLDTSFDHFTQKLLQLGLLKEKELHTCMLIKAQFKNKEMAQLLCLSPEGISSVRRRLCARFLDGKKEPKEWDRFILSL
jgi:tetratricopeptide (TPR) repeat protein